LLVPLRLGAFAVLAAPILSSFAATPDVEAAALDLSVWLVIIPFAGVAGFVLDGVFVGASWTRGLLITMIGASLVYAASLWLTWPLGAHGLWLSFVIFLTTRAILQLAMMPGLLNREFGKLD